jgi:hypothetical protein
MDNNIVFDRPEEKLQSVLTEPIINLVKQYQQGLIDQRKGETASIHVDEIASKVARFYEKIRKVVDWKEENVMRRGTIIRILKRNLLSKITNLNFNGSLDVDKLAESLTMELIRGGHLPNDEVPQKKIEDVAWILRKCLYILEKAPFNQGKGELLFKKKVNFYDWLLEIAACEIEEVLASPIKENALIKAMTLLMNDRIHIISGSLSPEEKKTLTYIAVCRTLFDLDEPFITYHILTHRYPEWNNPSPEFLDKVTQEIFVIDEGIKQFLIHPLSRDFFNVCERTDTVFTLLGDLLENFRQEPEKIIPLLNNKPALKEVLTKFYEKRLKTLKRRLFRIAVLSSLSVFVSNWFSFFIVEIPLARLFYEGFNFLAAIVDFVIPAMIMFILVAMIRPPSAGNLDKVIDMAFEFIYRQESKEIFEIRMAKKRSLFIRLTIGLLYLAGTVISFGTIGWIFYIARIPITSVILDTMMIALNVSAALVVRNKARELTVQDKASFGEFFLDVLSVPVAEVGNRLANKWKEYNIVGIFFTVVIDLPFLAVVDFIEGWRQFINQRKADIH